jgi:transposase InsO family protein
MSTDENGNLMVNQSSPSPIVAHTAASVSEAGGGEQRRSSQPNSNGVDPHLIDLAVELERRGMKAPQESERIKLIEQIHFAGGHFGRDAIFRALWSKKLWWPNIRNDIETVLSNCDPCARYVVTKSGFHPASFITSNGPWDHIQIDCSVHLPISEEGYTALLVIIDVFTGFVILRPIKTTSAEIVARKVWKIFCLFGIPKILQSDNGPEFVNEILRSLVKVTGIDHRLISPYNPRADGKVERAIGTVTSIIKKMLHGSINHWPLFVPFAQSTFNQKITSLTHSAPFSLMFGRTFNEFRDYSGASETMSTMGINDWKAHQEKILSVVYPSISHRIHALKEKMLVSVNKRRRLLNENSIPTGAIVMLIDPKYLNDPGKKPKWEPKYIGPYTVVRRARNGAYVLKDATGDLLDRHIPADQLKLVKRHIRLHQENTNVFEVGNILNHRGTPGAYEYLVQWKGYDDSEASWVLQEDFQDTDCITKYWKSLSTSTSLNRPHVVGLGEGC